MLQFRNLIDKCNKESAYLWVPANSSNKLSINGEQRGIVDQNASLKDDGPVHTLA